MPYETMSACMKAMQANDQGQAQEQNFPCCDVPFKSMCPDVGTCLAKCSVYVIAILSPAEGRCLSIHRHCRPVDSQQALDRAVTPPAPPPRA